MDKICFVVCPIGEDSSDIRKRSDQVLRHIIEPVCKEQGFSAIRVDKIHTVDKIDETIIEHLQKDALVIADLSDNNPNAYFELGYRSALNKPLIHIADEGQKLPFDVSGIRTIFYKLSDPDKLEECKNRLSETINIICMETEDTTMPSCVTTITPTIPSQTSLSSQILTNLLDIKDLINSLNQSIEAKDDKLLKQIISVFANQLQANSSPQDRAIEFAFKELIKDPDKMLNLISKFPDGKSPTRS